MVAKFQPPGRQAIFHTENGILDFGEAPPAGEEDWDLINAGKKAVTLKPGAAFFHHADSFAMVRGGHLDVAILGAYEVAENGDLANWRPGRKACRRSAAPWISCMAPSASRSSPTMSPRTASPSW